MKSWSLQISSERRESLELYKYKVKQYYKTPSIYKKNKVLTHNGIGKLLEKLALLYVIGQYIKWYNCFGEHFDDIC